METSGPKSASVFQRGNIADKALSDAAENLQTGKQQETEKLADEGSLMELEKIAEAVDLAIELEDN